MPRGLRFFVAAVTTALAASLASGCATPPLPAAPPATWVADPAHSRVDFELEHRGRPLAGRFGELTGSLEPPGPGGDLKASPRLHVAVRTGSVDTANALRDAHLRTGGWLDAGGFPAVSFESDTVTPHPRGLLVAGRLTFLGVERPLEVVLQAQPKAAAGEAQGAAPIAIHTASFAIHRSDFGMTAGLRSGVGDEVRLHVVLVWRSGPA